VCYNDLLGMGAVRLLESRGLRVPHDISVVGYDDISQDYGFEPALTSIRFDRLDMGRRAIAMLCEASDEGEHQHETLSVQLIVRDSTCLFRAHAALS
jgi:DNA-binding LacI/PurR family transcriptional regulator